MKYVLAFLILTGIVFAGSTREIETISFGPHEIVVECTSGNVVVTVLSPFKRIGGTHNAVDLECK